jgi:hypothetical protein
LRSRFSAAVDFLSFRTLSAAKLNLFPHLVEYSTISTASDFSENDSEKPLVAVITTRLHGIVKRYAMGYLARLHGQHWSNGNMMKPPVFGSFCYGSMNHNLFIVSLFTSHNCKLLLIDP